MLTEGTQTSSGTANTGEPATGSTPRRGHISRACDACRRRHIKCDEEPQCGQCALNRSPCERTGTDHRRERSAAGIAQLETRVSELETELAARTAELNTLATKTAELEAKTADCADKAAALETANKQLLGEVTMLRLAMELRASLSISGSAAASPHLTPPSVPGPRDGSPDPTRYLRPTAFHGSEYLPIPYDRTQRRHHRALSEHSVSRGRSGLPSTASSAVPSPHIPTLFIEPEPPGGWNLTATSSASASALQGFLIPPQAVASPNVSGYTHAYPAGGTPTVPVAGDAADDDILFAAWMGVPEVSSGSGDALFMIDDQQMDV